jgi:hypothetical protein
MEIVMNRNKHLKNSIAGFLAFFLILTLILPIPVQAATTPSDIVSKVKSAVGTSKYPFSSADSVKSTRKVFGVDVSLLDGYSAYEKTTGSGSDKVEYILFIGKATSKSNAKKAKNALKNYVSDESESMENYLSKTGKTNFKKAQISYSGEWVWCVLLDSGVNKKAVKAIKKAK